MQGVKYVKHFSFLFSSYLLGESTAGVKLQATCHKEQVYFSGIFGNPGKCEARFFGQAGLRAGLATVLPGGLSSPAAPLSVEGKWEAPQPRPCPLRSSQDYCAYKSIFPNQTPQNDGSQQSRGLVWAEPVGFWSGCVQMASLRERWSCADRSLGTLLSAPTCAPLMTASLCAMWTYKSRSGCREDSKMYSCIFFCIFRYSQERGAALQTNDCFSLSFGAMKRAQTFAHRCTADREEERERE